MEIVRIKRTNKKRKLNTERLEPANDGQTGIQKDLKSLGTQEELQKTGKD